jgi:hypothetical protein
LARLPIRGLMKRSSGPRKTANLPESVHGQLNVYALAASAAGVGILALAQSAEAKIVYTRVNETLGFGVTNLDLNNDGTPDFGFCIFSNSSDSCPLERPRSEKRLRGNYLPGPFEDLFVFPGSAGGNRNQIWGSQGAVPDAYALRGGISVGGKQQFTPGAKGMAGCFAATTSRCGGLWYNASHRYLALKFVISGKVHYGWARLTVKGCCSATLTGYAYETIPNKPIITGDIVGGTIGIERC